MSQSRYLHCWCLQCLTSPTRLLAILPPSSPQAGALLACGIVNCGVSNECDPALALLSDYIKHKSVNLRLTATMGLGLAYAGSAREDVLVAVSPGMDSEFSPDVVGLTALSLGLIAVGTGHGELTESLVQVSLKSG